MVLQAPTACLRAYENAVWIPAFAVMTGDGGNPFYSSVPALKTCWYLKRYVDLSVCLTDIDSTD
ncbi:hypothetical protein TH1_20725 [Thalassospira lucentensis MCCC 1A00383 = DSM 14000]|nr:hypothetical protein TH1_20725 [Thalassospira lucentensis MCCC 1A00383 = DSM 14000]